MHPLIKRHRMLAATTDCSSGAASGLSQPAAKSCRQFSIARATEDWPRSVMPAPVFSATAAIVAEANMTASAPQDDQRSGLARSLARGLKRAFSSLARVMLLSVLADLRDKRAGRCRF